MSSEIEYVDSCDECGKLLIGDEEDFEEPQIQVNWFQPLQGEPDYETSMVLLCSWECFDIWVGKGRPHK